MTASGYSKSLCNSFIVSTARIPRARPMGRRAGLEERAGRPRSGRSGDIRMRNLWAVLLAVSLGLALGACSKCDVPDLLPKSCKGGSGPGQV